jgi:hypothetical protein
MLVYIGRPGQLTGLERKVQGANILPIGVERAE